MVKQISDEKKLLHSGFLSRLLDFMAHKSINAEKLALISGVSPQAISNYINKGGLPNAQVLAAWASKLDMNVNWLLTGEGEMLRTAPRSSLAAIDDEKASLFRENREVQNKNRILLEEIIALHKAAAQENFGDAPAPGTSSAVLSLSRETKQGAP